MSLNKSDRSSLIKIISIAVVVVGGVITYVEARFSTNEKSAYIEKKVDVNKYEIDSLEQTLKEDVREIRGSLRSINDYILTKGKK